MPKVLNFYHIGKVIPDNAVYIGRVSYKFNLPESIFANPYPLNKDGSNRDEVIEEYRLWLWSQIQSGDILIEDLLELEFKDLVCYCSPKRCHGDVILKAVEWAKQQRGK